MKHFVYNQNYILIFQNVKSMNQLIGEFKKKRLTLLTISEKDNIIQYEMFRPKCFKRLGDVTAYNDKYMKNACQ